MTLVLGACTADAVVLGADSKAQRVWVNPATGARTPGGSYVSRKLFKIRSHVGIATYGGGPDGVSVPDEIARELQLGDQPERSVDDVIAFLQHHFQGAAAMHALVGGLDERGDPVLFDVPMNGRPLQIVAGFAAPAPLVLRGLEPSEQPQREPGTPASVIAQMLELLVVSTGPGVGPPYDFLVIPRPPAV